jgi:hypothetical protein
MKDGMTHLVFVIYRVFTTRSIARTVSQKFKLRRNFILVLEIFCTQKDLNCEHFADFFSRPQLAYF